MRRASSKCIAQGLGWREAIHAFGIIEKNQSIFRVEKNLYKGT